MKQCNDMLRAQPWKDGKKMDYNELQVSLPVCDGLNHLVVLVLRELVGGGGDLRESLLEVGLVLVVDLVC